MTTAATIEVKTLIDDGPYRFTSGLLVALCFLVVVADGMDVAIMGFVAPSILQDWNISGPAFALVSLRARRIHHRDGLHKLTGGNGHDAGC